MIILVIVFLAFIKLRNAFDLKGSLEKKIDQCLFSINSNYMKNKISITWIYFSNRIIIHN